MEPADRRFKMKWWGWGAENVRASLSQSPATLDYLRNRLGVERLETPSALRLESVHVPPSRLDEPLREKLAAIVGRDNCRDDARERVLHSFGKSYKDLVRLRRLEVDKATDVVVYPRNEAEVSAVLACCREMRLAVIPFGGGTNVVGGLEPEAGGHRLVVTLDLALLNHLLEVDETAQTATVEAGIFGPELEARLAERGFMLGHFPQSFEFSTLGGWIATRSSGQNSLRYGGIDKLVESVRIVTPQGTIETLRVPRRADGPDLTQMLIGSEGIYGVIVSATVRIRRLAEAHDYWMYAFKDFPTAVEAGRTLVQAAHAPPSCEPPTRKRRPRPWRWDTGRPAADGRCGGDSGNGCSRGGDFARRNCRRCWSVWRARPSKFADSVGPSADSWRTSCAFRSGRSLGRRWLATRFELPYLRDELLDNHLLVDTLETATTWSGLHGLYAAVRSAIETAAAAQGEPIVVFTHVSHLYPDGASLYFSLLGRQKKADPIGQWWAIKRAAGDAIRQTVPSSAIITAWAWTTVRRPVGPLSNMQCSFSSSRRSIPRVS